VAQDLAFDLSLAALLGDNIYNFGELLAHPIVNSLSISSPSFAVVNCVYFISFFVMCQVIISMSTYSVVHFGFILGCELVTMRLNIQI
jgi:hypothetical protein